MNRRALTLVEVLAATVLLAMIAGTCVPFLQQATRALRPDDVGVDVRDLAALADAVMTQPLAFDIDDLNVLDEETIDWPDTLDFGERPTPGAITVRRLEAEASSDAGADSEAEDEPREHVWIVFTCEGTNVYRWLPVDEPDTPVRSPGNGDAGQEEPDP